MDNALLVYLVPEKKLNISSYQNPTDSENRDKAPFPDEFISLYNKTKYDGKRTYCINLFYNYMCTGLNSLTKLKFL